MANSNQARKRARQAIKRRNHNMGMRSALRTSIKQVISAIDSGDRATAQAAYQAAVPKIDNAVNKGLIHKNKAARHKARLNTRVQALA
ncbi:MAG: 30S ribosomal protein S20 [Gammaproteobacteria bacterium]|nr:30S ribosomal protein S20 [Gammaproteobacteria bacterium]